MKYLAALAALSLLAATPAQAQVTYSPTYGQDRAEIEDLMARYLFAIDYFDWEAYVATFAPEGELEFASGKYVGHDQIRAAVTRFAEGIGRFYHTADGKPAILRHIVLQSSIRVEGERAWGRTIWLEMANHGPNDEPKIGTYGLYEDEFRKIDGHWLIARRNVLNEFIRNRGSGPENPVGEMDALAAAFLAGR